MKNKRKKMREKGLVWWSIGQNYTLPLQGPLVQSLVGKLHIPLGVAKKEKHREEWRRRVIFVDSFHLLWVQCKLSQGLVALKEFCWWCDFTLLATHLFHSFVLLSLPPYLLLPSYSHQFHSQRKNHLPFTIEKCLFL